MEFEVKFDKDGNALAVWSEYDGTRWRTYANRYTAGSSWGIAQSIDADVGDARAPTVAFDGSGNALAVWQEHNGTRNQIYSRGYSAKEGWGTAQSIDVGLGDAAAPALGMDPEGNAFAVWAEGDSSEGQIYANRYVRDTGWGSAVIIESAVRTRDFGSPRIALNATGGAVAVWSNFASAMSETRVYASRYQ